MVLPCSSRYKIHSSIFVYPEALGSRLLSFPRQERGPEKAGLGGRGGTGEGVELADEKELCWCSRKPMMKIQVRFLILCQNYAKYPETCSSKTLV